MPGSDRVRAGAYGAAACATAYGSMKLAQALGANALADRDPLPPDLRARLLARDPLFVASHWALAGAAVIGVVVALATVRPWGTAIPRRPLLVITWTLGTIMIVRSVGPLGLGFAGDGLLLAGVRPAPAGHAALVRSLARWDLLLWSPFFLLWGVCWVTAGWRLARSRPASAA
ncbi:DUF3995 domain-containing protein [Actinoallomurus soli]|uniref:DUF3995 domain-containing protein n=1 Tax=Actinoallomurus soli TaxID=2952535 RepID=UPI002092AAAB|nr:DUF3995 domain-containing protein [Actinoallomurus soli]MCO5968713.1 DUF3995 domain-containing protein [Actinoallomurus soli]